LFIADKKVLAKNITFYYLTLLPVKLLPAHNKQPIGQKSLKAAFRGGFEGGLG